MTCGHACLFFVIHSRVFLVVILVYSRTDSQSFLLQIFNACAPVWNVAVVTPCKMGTDRGMPGRNAMDLHLIQGGVPIHLAAS